MRKISFICTALLVVIALSAQTLQPIKLVAPSKERGSSIMKSLSDRRSTREFSDRKLSAQDLSDVIWAANGINRPADGKKTAPSAMNKQDIDIFVIMEEGAYLYEPKTHSLKPVATGDFRPLIADSQPYINKVPVCLLMVSDISRFDMKMDMEIKKQWAAFDAGIISQNISLFCSGCGLVTVPRAFMKKDELKKALKLSATQEPMLNNPVGYPLK